MFFANTSTIIVLLKCKMVCATSGTTKQAPKLLQISIVANAHVVHAFLVQLRANGMKIFTWFVLFWLKIVHK